MVESQQKRITQESGIPLYPPDGEIDNGEIQSKSQRKRRGCERAVVADLHFYEDADWGWIKMSSKLSPMIS